MNYDRRLAQLTELLTELQAILPRPTRSPKTRVRVTWADEGDPPPGAIRLAWDEPPPLPENAARPSAAPDREGDPPAVVQAISTPAITAADKGGAPAAPPTLLDMIRAERARRERGEGGPVAPARPRRAAKSLPPWPDPP